MEIISDTVIYIMMAFVLIGAVAAIRDDQGALAKSSCKACTRSAICSSPSPE